MPLFVLTFLWPYVEEFLEGISQAAKIDDERLLPVVAGVLSALIIIIAKR